jgi:hypothetical protein
MFALILRAGAHDGCCYQEHRFWCARLIFNYQQRNALMYVLVSCSDWIAVDCNAAYLHKTGKVLVVFALVITT